MKKLVAEEVRQKIQEGIDYTERAIEVREAVAEIVSKYEGKKISKRIGTALAGILPSYTVVYRHQYNLCQLLVWGNGIEWKDRISILLGYDSEGGYVNSEKIVGNYNRNVFLERERLGKFREALERIGSWVTQSHKIAKEIEALKKDVSAYNLQHIILKEV